MKLPKVPVHAIAWFQGRHGYNTHTRGFFEALAKRRPVFSSPLIGLEGPWQEDQNQLAELYGQDLVSIALLYGSLMDVLATAPGPKVAYTVWESTRIPADWQKPLGATDRIWVPSTWGRQVMIDNGFPARQVDVVPEGVDATLFCPDGPKTDAFGDGPEFRFLNIGRYEDRKGTRLLIEAFDAEFGPDEPVKLLVACHNSHDKDYDLPAILRSIGIRHSHKLAFIPPFKSFELVASLYRACDAFVSPFRAEGWGLPLIEAMACGLPVIATDYSAPRDFLGAESYRLKNHMVAIDKPYFESIDGDYGVWAEPDRDHLRVLMRTVYENREQACRRGLQASARIRRTFSWDRAAAIADDLIATISAPPIA